MHNLYVSFGVKDLQKAMFRKESLPAVVMNPQDANSEFIRGNVELVRISEAEGRIAAEGALPYPHRGVVCGAGEVWGGAVQRYFLALEEGVNLLPGFSPELQGVYSETDADGIKRLYGYVLSSFSLTPTLSPRGEGDEHGAVFSFSPPEGRGRWRRFHPLPRGEREMAPFFILSSEGRGR